jgi:prophage regulatory protein
MPRSRKNVVVIQRSDDRKIDVDSPAAQPLPPQEKLERVTNVALRMIRFPDVRNRTGLSRSTIWRLERQGEFPKHRRISPNAVAWIEHEVDAWIRRRMVG